MIFATVTTGILTRGGKQGANNWLLSVMLLAIAMMAISVPSNAASSQNNCPSNFKRFEGTTNAMSCFCAARRTTSGRVWGTRDYTADSSICRSAVHAGMIPHSGGKITVRGVRGRTSYTGSTRNGVKSSRWGSYGWGFIFEGKKVVKTAATLVKAKSNRPQGVWKGTYVCGNGVTGATFKFRDAVRSGYQRALMNIYTVEGGARVSQGVVEYFIDISKKTGKFSLRPSQYIKEPANFLFVSFKFPRHSGTETRLQGEARGKGCKTISLVRVDGKYAANESKVKSALQPLWKQSHKSFNMLGEWSGVAICRRKLQKVKVKIFNRNRGSYTAEFKAYNSFSMVLKAVGDRNFTIKSPSRSIGKKAELRLNSGVPPVLVFRVKGGCSRVFVVKHLPMATLGGVYKTVNTQRNLCTKVVGKWFNHGDKLARKIKAMKEEFYPHLKAYNGPSAVARSLFADRVFVDFFGVKAADLAKDDFERLQQQIKACVLTEPDNDYGSDTGSQIFTKRSIAFAKSKVIREAQFDGRNLLPTKGFAVYSKNRKAFALRPPAADLLKGWRTARVAPRPIIALEQLVAARSKDLIKASPEDILTELALIRKATKALRLLRNAQRNAQRMARNKKLLQSISIPYSRINTRYHRILQDLATGKPVQLDDTSRLFFGGMAVTLYGRCNVKVHRRDISAFLLFLKSTGDRSVFGSDFSNPDLRRSLGNLVGGNVVFQAGIQSAKTIGCAPPTPNTLVQLVIDAIKSNSEDAEGRDPIFIRSCAPVLSHRKCLCVAKLGAAVFPNINQRRYSRAIMARIIRGNPMVGLQVAGLCGVTRY